MIFSRSGQTVGSCFQNPGGPQMIVSSGIACGILLGVIEGVGVLMQRMFAEGNRPVAPQVRLAS